MAKIVLNYKDEDFNDKKKYVEITFINQRMSGDFSKLVGDITTIQMLNGLIDRLTKEKGAAVMDKDKTLAERREAVELIDGKLEKAREEFAAHCHDDIVERRYNLIQLILKANHIGDKTLYERDFWDNYVDPAEINEFMAACIMKDKKKE